MEGKVQSVDTEAELSNFTKGRTVHSGAALVLYLVAVVLSQSMLVAVAGGFALLVVRSWLIDRILFLNGVVSDELQRTTIRTAREDAEQTRAVLMKIRRECARPRRRPTSDDS